MTKKENKTSSYPEKNKDNVYLSSTYNELTIIILNEKNKKEIENRLEIKID